MNGIAEDQSMELIFISYLLCSRNPEPITKKNIFYSAFAALMVIEEIGFFTSCFKSIDRRISLIFFIF